MVAANCINRPLPRPSQKKKQKRRCKIQPSLPFFPYEHSVHMYTVYLYVHCANQPRPRSCFCHLVYPSGDVCISILHPPEEDEHGYESAAERWSPVQTPQTILLSVISMLSSPNDESPANVEAAMQWRDDPKEFKRRTRRCVNASLETI